MNGLSELAQSAAAGLVSFLRVPTACGSSDSSVADQVYTDNRISIPSHLSKEVMVAAGGFEPPTTRL